jgi:hypothetical protein
MGQTYYLYNKTKREYILPSILDAGYKLLEWAFSETLMHILVILLDPSYKNFTFAGRWAGDDICAIGEYTNKLDDEPWSSEIMEKTNVNLTGYIFRECDKNIFSSEVEYKVFIKITPSGNFFNEKLNFNIVNDTKKEYVTYKYKKEEGPYYGSKTMAILCLLKAYSDDMSMLSEYEYTGRWGRDPVKITKDQPPENYASIDDMCYSNEPY